MWLVLVLLHLLVSQSSLITGGGNVEELRDDDIWEVVQVEELPTFQSSVEQDTKQPVALEPEKDQERDPTSYHNTHKRVDDGIQHEPSSQPEVPESGWNDRIEWYTAFEPAMLASKRLGKPLLMVVHGNSATHAWTQRLKNSIASVPPGGEFETLARGFVMLHLFATQLQPDIRIYVNEVSPFYLVGMAYICSRKYYLSWHLICQPLSLSTQTVPSSQKSQTPSHPRLSHQSTSITMTLFGPYSR